MARFSIVLIGIALIAVVTADQAAWESFKLRHGKKYKNAVEERVRMKNFMNNLKEIAEHNDLFKSGVVRFEKGKSNDSNIVNFSSIRSNIFNRQKGLNEFSDMSHDELQSKMNGYSANDESFCGGLDYPGEPIHVVPHGATVPKAVDWRERGAVTPVKNQGLCNTCWAFSSCGALEAARFLKTGRLIALSAQNLLDCVYPYAEQCYIGTYRIAYDHIRRNGGIETEQSYPYVGEKTQCTYNSNNWGANVRGHVRIACGNETALAHALATVGPVTVAINAELMYHYKSGVFSNPKCSQQMNHEILAVGYGTNEEDGDYYIIKNSWGTSWGENGFLKLARNQDNLCGVANDAGYPVV